MEQGVRGLEAILHRPCRCVNLHMDTPICVCNQVQMSNRETFVPEMLGRYFCPVGMSWQ